MEGDEKKAGRGGGSRRKERGGGEDGEQPKDVCVCWGGPQIFVVLMLYFVDFSRSVLVLEGKNIYFLYNLLLTHLKQQRLLELRIPGLL